MSKEAARVLKVDVALRLNASEIEASTADESSAR